MNMNVSKFRSLKLGVIAAAISTALIAPSHADVLNDVSTAVKESKANVVFRYRVETVDQDGIDEDALASTLKTRLTWKTGTVKNISALVEVDNVAYIGNDQFNATDNGKTEYPVVVDPDGTDLNQAAIKYTGKQLSITGGRQRIVLDNQRFVGGVAWRQNEQTFDGARFVYQATDALKFDYSYVFNVNRIHGPDDGANPADWHGNFHFVNTSYKINKEHVVKAFAYLFDNDDAAANSTNTYGVDYTGNFGPVTANLAYASQSDSNDNPNDFDADYYKAELSGKLGTVKLAAGIETLGSDNGVGFGTPLATGHKFQGFADKFLSTPGDGIEDVYVSAVTKVAGVKLVAAYHDFSSDENDIDYGTEIDLVAAYQLNKQTNLMLKFASYDADDFATDTTKFWAMATVAF